MDKFASLPAMYRRAYSGAKSRARKQAWKIMNHEEFCSLVDQASGKCELTGHLFNDEFHVVPYRGRKPFKSYPWAPSLDRTNIEEGYEVENVRLVCAHVNNALSYLSDEVFAEMCWAFVAKKGMGN